MLMNGERVGNERNRRGKEGREVVVVVRKLAIQFWQLRFYRRKKKKVFLGLKVLINWSLYAIWSRLHVVNLL